MLQKSTRIIFLKATTITWWVQEEQTKPENRRTWTVSFPVECTLEIKLKSIPISGESFYEVPVATEKKKRERQNGKFFLNQCGQCCLFSLTIQNWWLTSTFGTLRSLLWAIALLASHRHCHFPGSIIPFYWGCGTYLLTRAEGSEAEQLPDTKERREEES